jgi:hypothetical protein
MITELGEVTESRLCWPETKPRTVNKVDSPFRHPEVAKAARGVEREMSAWKIRAWILSRNHQRIYAGDPGAALWWNDRKGELRVLAADKYTKLADNIHAIELTLSAMRGLERWGAYTAEQATEGARLALPSPDGKAIDWRGMFGDVAGLANDQRLVLAEHRYRSLAREASSDEGRLRELNLAIDAARKELG